MTQGPCSTLKVEPLNPTHLAWFPQLQGVLLGDLVARIEQRFPDLLPSRSPRCVVGVDAEGPLAAAVSYPINRRGSCWTLHWPQQLRPSAQVSRRTVQRTLLQAAELSTGAQLLRPVQGPAAAAPIDRMGDRGCQGAISINANDTTGGAAGQKIWKALLDPGGQITQQHTLQLGKPGKVRWIEWFNLEGGAGALSHHIPPPSQ